MNTLVSGKNITIGHSLQSYVRDALNNLATKYSLDITSSDVVFHKEGHFYACDIITHDSGLGMIKASYKLDEVYSSFDTALIRIEKQLRKHKTKLIDRHHKKSVRGMTMDEDFILGTKYIINPHTNEEQETEESSNPIIIAEKATNIEKLTVKDAVMKMDFGHLPALLFINKTNNQLNVVYQRPDGNIAWVSPDEQTKFAK